MKEYFSHDYNSRNDKKIIKLSMKYGVLGIGIYWCIVEMLYEESGYLNINEYERISFELRTDYETVRSVIHDFDLFKIEGDLFYSESIINRLKERSNKSNKARESINKRWEKIKNNTNVLLMNNECNTIKVKESKVNNKKYIDIVYFEKDQEIDSAFKDYLTLRAKSKYSMTERAVTSLVNKLLKISGGDTKTALEIIDNAILGKWKSFYPLHENKPGQKLIDPNYKPNHEFFK